MTNPGPPSGDPLAGPDADMGMPESGTHHATSTDRPMSEVTAADVDRFPLGDGPRAVPRGPVYEDSAELVDTGPAIEPTPAYDALAEETGLGDPLAATVTPLAVDYDQGAASGPLGKVTAFAAEQPAAFIAAALVAGWLVGKLLGSSDDDD